jgi:hypothetical protein
MPKSDHDKLVEEQAGRVRLVGDYESKIAEYTQVISRLTKEGKMQTDFQIGLSEEITRLQAVYREAQKSIKAKDTIITSLSSQNDSLEAQLREQEQNLLESVDGEFKRLQAANATLENENAELKAKVRGIEDLDLDGAEAEFKALEEKNVEKDQEISQLKERLVQLQAELQGKLDGAEIVIKESEEKLTQAQEEILALQTQAKEAGATNNAALNDANTTITSQQQTIAELKAQAAALQIESASLGSKSVEKELELRDELLIAKTASDEAKITIANQQRVITDQGGKLAEMEEQLLVQRLAKLQEPNIDLLNQAISNQAKLITSMKEQIEKQKANVIPVVAQVQNDEPKIDGSEEAKGVEISQGESTLSGNSVSSTITLPAGAPTVDHGFLSDANIAKINAVLDKAGWSELNVTYKDPDSPGSRTANSSKDQQEFYVHESKLVTNHQDPKVFAAMLTAFKAANSAGVDPVITAPDPAVKAMWEQAVKEVYGDDVVVKRINEKIKVDSPVVEKEQSTKAEQAPDDKLKLKTADGQAQSGQDLLKSTQSSHSVLTPVTTPTPNNSNTSHHR